MAFPSIVATNTSSTGSNSTATVNLPASIVAGDLLIVTVAAGLITGGAPGTFTWPAGYTSLYSATITFTRLETAYRIADGNEGSTISVTFSGSCNSVHVAYRIQGHNSIRVPATGNATSSTDPPSLSPSWGAAETLWIAVVGGAGTGAQTITSYPTNYTLSQIKFDSAFNAAVGMAARQLETASEDPGAFTIGGTGPAYNAQTIAVAPSVVITNNATLRKLNIIELKR